MASFLSFVRRCLGTASADQAGSPNLDTMTDQSPAFLLYAKDFYSGCADLTAAEAGVYIRALCWSWDNGPLPTAFERRSRVCLCTVDDFTLIWPNIEHLWHLTEAGWVNDKLEAVRTDRREFLAAKSRAGIASGVARRRANEQRSNGVQTETTVRSNEQGNTHPNENEPSISIFTKSTDQNLPADAGSTFPQPVENLRRTLPDAPHPRMAAALPDRPAGPAARPDRPRVERADPDPDRETRLQPAAQEWRDHQGDARRRARPRAPAVATGPHVAAAGRIGAPTRAVAAPFPADDRVVTGRDDGGDEGLTPADAAREIALNILQQPGHRYSYDAYCLAVREAVDALGIDDSRLRNDIVSIAWRVTDYYPQDFAGTPRHMTNGTRAIWRTTEEPE